MPSVNIESSVGEVPISDLAPVMALLCCITSYFGDKGIYFYHLFKLLPYSLALNIVQMHVGDVLLNKHASV